MSLAMNFRGTIEKRIANEFLEDIVSTLEAVSNEGGDCTVCVGGCEDLPFSMANLHLAYRVRAKERELLLQAAWMAVNQTPLPEIYCENCGDGSKHVMGRCGGIDSMCVMWDKEGGDVYFSCRSCYHDVEHWDVDEPLISAGCHSCIGCGIHRDLFDEHEYGVSLTPVCICLQDSKGTCATNYYFCDDCILNHGRDDGLEKLVIERITKIQTFINGQCDEIVVPFDEPETPRRRLFEDDEETIVDEAMRWAEVLNSDEEFDETYEDEYENEDLSENNTEKATEIKEAVREVGEKIFDLQEQLKEGDYLVIMNLLQKVTNGVNSL
jgi:hypothetical protein